MQTFDEVLNAAQVLPTDERIRLIDALWDTFPVTDLPGPSDEWIAEAQRRSDDYDAGRMTASPWSEVRQRARHKAGLDD